MALWSRFLTPADIDDFADNPGLREQLQTLWSERVDGFTQQSITGTPWQVTYSSGITAYLNPLRTDPGTFAASPGIRWEAMPGRIKAYFPNLTNLQRWSLADTGYSDSSQTTTFGRIVQDPCNPNPDQTQSYPPYGPRGWQDEYCEWSITYDDLTKNVDQRKVLRLDFVCENPEYWHTLWNVDPNRVVALYNEVLNYPAGYPAASRNVNKVVTLDDLTLKDPSNPTVPVIDPFTGGPAYNPLNAFNNGPAGSPTTGGVMHLTSTPNTVQTEIGLAGQATLQRNCGNSVPQTLICCAQYGQVHRNSDPHIGQSVNLAVAAGLNVTLANPPGLYLQNPVWPSDAWVKFPATAPANARLQDYFRVLRGAETLNDPNGQPFSGNFYLHYVIEIPADQGFCLSDIQILDQDGSWHPLRGGAQISEWINVQIFPAAYLGTAPGTPLPCVGNQDTYAWPLQLLYRSVWDAAINTSYPTVVGQTMTLASNTVIIPPRVSRGATTPLVLTWFPSGASGTTTLAFVDDNGQPASGVGVTVSDGGTAKYCVPGNTIPSQVNVLRLSVAVDPSATPGVFGIRFSDNDQPNPPVAPAFLTIV